MRKIIYFLLLLTTFVCAQNSAETDISKNISKISPPTPEAYKFATYGNLPIGLFTGATNFNIPLTAFTSGNLSIPISLNYASNGIKIDDMNGSVGLGWTFINAGIITRVIRDIADENDTFDHGDVPDINSLGMNDQTVKDYLSVSDTNGFDSEPDLYMANFAGKNIKFVIDRSGNIKQLEKTSCKIEGAGSGFVITSEDGVKYIFGAIEYVKNSVTNAGMHGDISIDATASYLTKIIDENNRETNIEYYDKNFTSTVALSQSMSYTRGGPPQYVWGSPQNDPNYVFCSVRCELVPFVLLPRIGLVSESVQNVFGGKQIKKIYDQNNNFIEFTYTNQPNDFDRLSSIQKYTGSVLVEHLNLNYGITPTNRTYLSAIVDAKSQSRYSFEYYNINGLPARLSLKRDLWGYYNGRNNTNLIPQVFDADDQNAIQYSGADQSVNPDVGYYGLLKSITYPTGGNSQISYENHKIKAEVRIPGSTSTSYLQAVSEGVTNNSSYITITPKKSGYVVVYMGVNLFTQGDCFNSEHLNTNKQNGTLNAYDDLDNPVNIYTLGTNNYYHSEGTSYTISHGNTAKLFISGIKNKPMKIKISANWFCSDASANIVYYSSDDNYIFKDKILGGYRVSSISDTPIEGAPIARNYSYLKSDGQYSTVYVTEPYFREIRNTKSVCIGGCVYPVDKTYNIITSTNINQYNGGQPNISYETVSEEISGGKGKIVHHFNVSNDNYGSIFGDDISGSSWSNVGWDNGKELLTEYKDQQGVTLKTIENKYDKNQEENLFGLSVRQKYEQPNSALSFDFDHLDFVFYKNVSRFGYLKSQVTTDYLNGTPLQTMTEYFYNNPSHNQLSNQKTTYPDLTTRETKYQYAQEKGNLKLIEANIVGKPLEITTFENNKAISKVETIYPTSLPTTQTGNLLLPLSVQSTKMNTISPLNPPIGEVKETEVTYDSYDNKGNLLQYTTKSGTPTSIIWGYNQTQPLAKIEGATYAQVSILSPNIINASVTDAALGTQQSEQDLINALDTLRKSPILANFLITTYTYDPLIGVRSITPPSGIREIYKYDTSNRLQSVVDIDGNILKEYKYNFKP